MTLVKNILTSTLWMNRAVINSVAEMTGKQMANADQTRTFVSFEGQDGFSPIIHIVFKK